MAPTHTDESLGQVATVQHRGKLLQVFLAPWRRPRSEQEEPHLHVQDLDGGAGQIVPLDHPLADDLRAFHPEVDQLVEPPAPTPPPYHDPPAGPADEPAV